MYSKRNWMKGGVEKRDLCSGSLGDVCCAGWMAAAGGKKELGRKKGGWRWEERVAAGEYAR